ncbi:MAG: hypothetical protein PHQ27_02220 [Victivallales bacterium]|nr:hypothetical protein [Victivallales bacterium]
MRKELHPQQKTFWVMAHPERFECRYVNHDLAIFELLPAMP